MPITVELPAGTGGGNTRKITELVKAPGDPVEKGEVLLTFDDNGKPGKVLSPREGTLDEYYVQENEEAEFNVPLCSIFTSEDESDDEAGDDDSEPDSDDGDGSDGKAGEKQEEPAVEYADPIQKIKNQMELITHRNMIVQVSEHILKRCDDDFDFYEQVHNPQKSLENCIQYINNQAKKVCDDMVKLNGNKPGGSQSIAIEGDQVFQWAAEYFRKENLTEDGHRAPSKPKDAKSKGKKSAAKGSAKLASKPAAAPASVTGQQSLF